VVLAPLRCRRWFGILKGIRARLPQVFTEWCELFS
jgi:hypothetical protein